MRENQLFEKMIQLRAPMKYQWREQSINAGGARLVAYITGRQVMSRFDAVFGPNWKVAYEHDPATKTCKATISVLIDGQWVSREDVGTESNMDPIKGAYSDALKRAAVAWGVGRFLYNLGELKIPCVQNQRGGKPETKDFRGKQVPVLVSARVKDDFKTKLWDKNEVNLYAHYVHRYGIGPLANQLYTRQAKEDQVILDLADELYATAEETRARIGDDPVDAFLDKVAPHPYRMTEANLKMVISTLSKVNAAHAVNNTDHDPDYINKLVDTTTGLYSLRLSSSNKLLKLSLEEINAARAA